MKKQRFLLILLISVVFVLDLYGGSPVPDKIAEVYQNGQYSGFYRTPAYRGDGFRDDDRFFTACQSRAAVTKRIPAKDTPSGRISGLSSAGVSNVRINPETKDVVPFRPDNNAAGYSQPEEGARRFNPVSRPGRERVFSKTINKNFVLFLTLTNEEYDSLSSGSGSGIDEVISDFNFHAQKITAYLKEQNIEYEFTNFETIRLADSKGSTFTLNRSELRVHVGIVLADGKNQPVVLDGVFTDVGLKEEIKKYFRLK